LVMAVAAAAVVFAWAIPMIVRGDTFVIATGSMTPTLPVHSFVVTRPVDTEDIRVGDILNFRRTPAATETVTHRVVGIDENGHFITRGDANDADDATTIPPSQVLGRYWYTVPFIGPLTSNPTVRMIALAVVGGLGLAWGGYQYQVTKRNKVEQDQQVGTTEELLRQLVAQNDELLRRLTLAGIPELPEVTPDEPTEATATTGNATPEASPATATTETTAAPDTDVVDVGDHR